MTSSDSIVRVDNVSMSFGGVKALSDVSFDVRESEFFAIIGPNGAGKTTLFNCLTSIYRPQVGSISIYDHNIIESKPSDLARLRVGRTFQNLGLFEKLDPVENILLGRHHLMSYGMLAHAVRWPSAMREERLHRQQVRDLVELLGLQSYIGTPVATLPYGVRKLVEMGRVMAMEPRLLMLDEPVAGMNRSETDNMARIIRRVHRELKPTILLVEHDMPFVMGLADRIFVLDFGQSIALGNPKEIQSNQKVIEAYLGVPA